MIENSPALKVIHLSQTDLHSGAGRAAYRIHHQLRQLGVASKMLVANKVSQDEDVIAPKAKLDKIWSQFMTPYLDSIPAQYLAKNPQGYVFSSAWLGGNLLPKIQAFSPDLIQLHWIGGGLLRLEDLAKLSQPIVWRLADMWAFTGAEHYTENLQRAQTGYSKENRPAIEAGLDLNRWVWERKQKTWKQIKNLVIVSPSQWLARCARSSQLLRDRRIEVIPTGQDLQVFRPLSRTLARQILRLPQDKQLILFGGLQATADPRKGFSYLQAALLKLADQDSSLELLIFGMAAPKAPPDLGFPTHYLGQFHDSISLALVYSAADVFVAPSTMENLANTVIEALACGTPCVAFNVGGMPDAIAHQQNGYLAQPLESEDLAQGISWVLEDSERWQRLSYNARKTAEQQFCQEAQARRYLSLYTELLEQP